MGRAGAPHEARSQDSSVCLGVGLRGRGVKGGRERGSGGIFRLKISCGGLRESARRNQLPSFHPL